MNTLNDYILAFVRDFVNQHSETFIADLRYKGISFKQYMGADTLFRRTLGEDVLYDVINLAKLARVEVSVDEDEMAFQIVERVKRPIYHEIKREFMEYIASEVDRLEEGLENYGHSDSERDKLIKQINRMKKELIDMQQ